MKKQTTFEHFINNPILKWILMPDVFFSNYWKEQQAYSERLSIENKKQIFTRTIYSMNDISKEYDSCLQHIIHEKNYGTSMKDNTFEIHEHTYLLTIKHLDESYENTRKETKSIPYKKN